MDLWLSPHDARVRFLQEGELIYGWNDTPFGTCICLMAGESILHLRFADEEEGALEALQTSWPRATIRRSAMADMTITACFARQNSVAVMAIGTPFQLSVWEFLRRGKTPSTITYGEVARSIGRPKAARAVGRAVGANGIAVLIPCHRVVSPGKLSGYRWGTERKQALLAWELANKDPLEMPF
jgi:AraC family transcriptional regulator, regulatory protein of adaptative response / methylated-DNA-[protein]-cysteine methyltransferase